MKTSARQLVAAAVETILLADLPSGTAVDLFTQLPNGTIPLSLEVLIVDPFDAATSDVIDLGNGTNGAAYLNDGDLKSAAGTRLAATALPPMVHSDTGGLQLKATRTAAGAAASKGELRVILTYAREGHEDFSEG